MIWFTCIVRDSVIVSIYEWEGQLTHKLYDCKYYIGSTNKIKMASLGWSSDIHECGYFRSQLVFNMKWAATWQNQQNACAPSENLISLAWASAQSDSLSAWRKLGSLATHWAPSEDSDQTGHLPSLIRVFAVRMKKAWVLSYPLSAQRRLWSNWADTHFFGFVVSNDDHE